MTYFIKATVVIPMDREHALKKFVDDAIYGYGQRLDMNPGSTRRYGNPGDKLTKSQLIDRAKLVAEMRGAEDNPKMTYAAIGRELNINAIRVKDFLRKAKAAKLWEDEHPGWDYANRINFYRQNSFMGGELI
jgi:hypothetical protein